MSEGVDGGAQAGKSKGDRKKRCRDCASAVQALCKHHARLVQAGAIYVQARSGATAEPMCFYDFHYFRAPPKYPYYNINKGDTEKCGSKT